MKRWVKVSLYVLALIGLCYIIQYQFTSSESSTPWHLPLSGKVIVIDSGHGGMDGGAVAKSGATEKELTLAIAEKLRDYLQGAGALVLMTREDDYDLAGDETKQVRQRKVEDLKRRVEIVNESGADSFISIHMNAIPSPRWYGAQTFYHRSHPDNEVLAKFIQDQVRVNLGNTKRLAKSIHNVYLLKNATIPGVLFEAGFLSHPDEASRLQTEEYQEQLAASIYQGMMRFYTDEEEPKE